MVALLGCIMVISSLSVAVPLKVFNACGRIYVPLISANVLAFEVLWASYEDCDCCWIVAFMTSYGWPEGVVDVGPGVPIVACCCGCCWRRWFDESLPPSLVPVAKEGAYWPGRPTAADLACM